MFQRGKNLSNIGSLKPYSFMKELISELKDRRIDYEILQVPFEFQRGSNKILRLICN